MECLEKLIVMRVWGGRGGGGGGVRGDSEEEKQNKTKIHIIKRTKTYTNNNTTRITKGLSAPGR